MWLKGEIKTQTHDEILFVLEEGNVAKIIPKRCISECRANHINVIDWFYHDEKLSEHIFNIQNTIDARSFYGATTISLGYASAAAPEEIEKLRNEIIEKIEKFKKLKREIIEKGVLK